MKIKKYDYAYNKKTRNVCIIEVLEKNRVLVEDVAIGPDFYYDEYVISPKTLVKLEPYSLIKENAIKIMELGDNFECVPNNNFIANFVLKEEINNPLSYIVKALDKMNKGIDYVTFDKWIKFIFEYDYIKYKNNHKTCEYSEESIFAYLIDYLADIHDEWYGEYDYIKAGEFDHVIEVISLFLKQKIKLKNNITISDYFMRYIICLYNEDDIDKATLKEQEFYKECVERLCKKNDVDALKRKGYCLYCGTRIYPTDWKECLKIFLKVYELTGAEYIANTIGYIYYYGRANNGIPEYDKAFKFFSIGALGGNFESIYKVGDCFRNGYGVVKNEETAYHLYNLVVNENIVGFINGEDNKFADGALRLGSAYENGLYVTKNYRTAYYWYLLADLAIKRRIGDHYVGDNYVAKSIKESLKRVRKEYRKTIKKNNNRFSFLEKINYDTDNLLRADIKKNKNGSYKLTITVDNDNMFLLSIPEEDYCGFRKSITYVSSSKAKIKVFDKKKHFYFDSVDNYDGTVAFKLNNRLSAILFSKELKLQKITSKK